MLKNPTTSDDQSKRPARFRLYCTTGDVWPLRLVDVTELFMHELKQRRVDQHWFCSGRLAPGPERIEQINGVPVTVSGAREPRSAVDKVRNLLGEWVADFAGLVRLLKDPVDIIQVRDKYLAALIAWPIARLSGARFTIWLSFPYPESEIDRADKAGLAKGLYLKASGVFGQLVLYRIGMRLADHVFVQSEQMKMNLIAHGVPAKKMTPVPMGVTPRVTSFRRERQSQTLGAEDREWLQQYIEPGTRTIFYLGTLDRDRELDLMIDAFAAVSKQIDSARLVLVGPEANAGDQQILQDRAEQLQVSDKVVFTGRLPMEQARKLLEKAEVCWCPILNNRILRVGSPTKLIEYMAFQKPVVVNEHPEQQAILEETGVGHCVAWSAQAFADATIQLMNDPQHARDMGMGGLAWVSANRTYDGLAKKVLRQYERLLDLEPGQSIGERLVDREKKVTREAR